MGVLCSKTNINSASSEPETRSSESSRSLHAKRSAFVKTIDRRWDQEYVITKTLGQGITGSVHLVKKIGTEDFFAKKSINIEDQDPAQMKELRNEIDLLRELDHPNIVHLYECFEHDGQIHLIMENCGGGELYAMLVHGSEDYHNFTEEEISKICHCSLSALAYCHSKGIVHRDLKPQNIVFPTAGDLNDVKIIDFGMSKRGMKRTIFGRRAIQTACGTPLYVAPEIICGARYDEKIDVWAIGVLTYTMACGRHPFQGKNQEETLDNIENHKGIKFQGSKWRKRSPILKSFIDLLLKSKISERPSAKEALRHPFLASGVVVEDTPAKQKNKKSAELTMERMKAFKSYPEMKRTALMAIAHKLHSNDIGHLREAFQKIDTSNSGTIDRSEFNQLASQLDIVDENELSDIFDAADIDGTGQICYGEFLAATLDTSVFLREDRLRDAFMLFDVDSSGTITCDNLINLLGDELSKPEIDGMIKAADIKQNGVIDFEEFLLLMRGTTGVASIAEPSTTSVEGGEIPVSTSVSTEEVKIDE